MKYYKIDQLCGNNLELRNIIVSKKDIDGFAKSGDSYINGSIVNLNKNKPRVYKVVDYYEVYISEVVEEVNHEDYIEFRKWAKKYDIKSIFIRKFYL